MTLAPEFLSGVICVGPDGLVVDPEVSGQLASAFNKFIMLASARIADRSSTQRP
jgi:hypothetical protein